MSVSKKARNVPARFLGAFKKGHRYSSRDMIDEDLSWELLDKIEKSGYKDQASIEALEYIAKFNNEFHKNVVSKTDPLHTCSCPDRKRGDKHLEGCLRNDLNDRENAKNRDIMSVQNENIKRTKVRNDEDSKAGTEYEEDLETVGKPTSYRTPYINPVEDAIIDLIDAQRSIDDMKDDTEH